MALSRSSYGRRRTDGEELRMVRVVLAGAGNEWLIGPPVGAWKRRREDVARAQDSESLGGGAG